MQLLKKIYRWIFKQGTCSICGAPNEAYYTDDACNGIHCDIICSNTNCERWLF